MSNEKTNSPVSGYIVFTVVFILFAVSLWGMIVIRNSAFLWLMGISMALMPGFFFVNPNNSVVLLLFGEHKGTVKANGFFWVNPFYIKKSVSLRARNFDSDKIKVNDKVGNPVQIGVILVWKVKDTFRASFDVDNYETFVKLQADSAVRRLTGLYPYDNFDPDSEITLRSGNEEVNHALEENLRTRLDMAGIEVIEARIGHLAYAPEIAGAMLRRQQASAVVPARFKIVEGAVTMVHMALSELSRQGIIDLDGERKAAMVSNLMVVLCGEKDATPVVNTGTLTH